MRRGLISILLIMSGWVAFGQQDPQFSQYMLNEIYYNPAFAGIPGTASFSALHRTQWLGYESTFDGAGNPQTQLITANMPLFKLNSGLGFYAVNDRIGALNNLEVQGAFAYHLAVKNSKLSFGIRAGVVSQSIDFDQYRWVDPDDPLRQSGKETQIRPDLSAGIYWQAQKYFLSLGASHLLNGEFNFGNDSLANALVTHLYFMAGYDYEINYDFILRPTVLVKSDLATYSFDISLLAYFREKLWFGLSFRQSDAMIAMIGYSFLKDNSLRLGYAFDYIINSRTAKKPTSHELLLSYTLPVLSGGEKRIIRTPRFRH